MAENKQEWKRNKSTDVFFLLTIIALMMSLIAAEWGWLYENQLSLKLGFAALICYTCVKYFGMDFHERF